MLSSLAAKDTLAVLTLGTSPSIYTVYPLQGLAWTWTSLRPVWYNYVLENIQKVKRNHSLVPRPLKKNNDRGRTDRTILARIVVRFFLDPRKAKSLWYTNASAAPSRDRKNKLFACSYRIRKPLRFGVLIFHLRFTVALSPRSFWWVTRIILFALSLRACGGRYGSLMESLPFLVWWG